MRCVHQFAEPSQGAAFERFDGGDRSGVFGDDVIAAATNGFGQGIGVKVEIVNLDIAQSLNIREIPGQPPDALFAFGAALVVFAGRQIVFDHRVANDDAGVLKVNRGGAIFQAAAIDHQGVAFDPQTGDVLIHNAASRPGKFVLGALGE